MINFAIDYDDTYTADPEFWNQVMTLGRQSGHTFVCVTNRRFPPGPNEIRPPAKVYCSPDIYKSITAAKYELGIDIWIDDSPSSIEPGFMPGWDAV